MKDSIKIFFSKHFRKDLNLKEKWWHRLISTLIFIGLLIVVTTTFSSSSLVEIDKKVDTLGDRLTDSVAAVDSLLLPGEYIGSLEGLEGLAAKTYCSSSIWDNLEEVSRKTGMEDYRVYSRSVNSYVKSPLGAHADEFRKSDTVCLTKDTNGSSSGDIDFLNDLSLYSRDTEIHMKDYAPIVSYSLVGPFVSGIIYIFAAYILYYKMFLYIVYGKRKSKVKK